MEEAIAEPIAHLEHYQGRQFRAYNLIMLACVAIGSLTFGYANSVIATVAAQPSFIVTFELDKRSNANDLIGLTNSLYFAGGVIGCLISPFCSDRWGRRWGIGVPLSWTIVAAALMAGSVNIAMFIVFRFVSGVSAFMLLAAIPVWMSEVAPPSIRGALVNVHNFALLVGYTVATWIGYGLFRINNMKIWRVQFAIMCFPALVLLPLLLWIPESPRWLIMKDRATEAEMLLHRLHPTEEARVEFIQIRRQLEIDRHLETSYLSMFTKPSYRKRCAYAFGLTVSVQLCGPLVINNYGPIVYALLGFDVEKQLLYLGGWVTTSIAGSIVSLFIIDLMPRPLLFSGGIIASISCLAAEAGLVANYATSPESLANPNEAALKAAVAMFYVFIFVLECFLGGCQWVYVGELFPTHIRTKGMAIGTCGLALTNVLWLQVAPIAFQNIGWKFYLCFICPAAVAAGIIFITFPDTKGLPLEKVAALFNDKVADDVIEIEELEHAQEKSVSIKEQH